jgi:Response regulator containing CheY-like receiver domain and AraC-type DNA-binding domain
MFSILIVDDNISDREGIKGLINWEILGIEVIGLAVDGLDGYKKAVELRPDFILTDVAMPVMDGIKMTQKVKAEIPKTKFIFMSCFDDFEFLKGAINLEVYGYILKPIDLLELTNAIEKIKNLRQAELEKEQNDEELKKQLKESMPILQEQFIRDLLYGKLENENEIRDRMEYLNIDFTNKFYSVLFLQIDNYDLLYPDITTEHRHLMIYSIQKCVEETILKDIPGYVSNQQYNSIAIILLIDNVCSKDALNIIIDSANTCKDIINRKLSLNITIGISEFSTVFKMMPEIFESAEYAVKSKFFSSGNRIILASEVKLPDNDFQYDVLELKRKINLIMECRDENDVISFIDECYNADVRYPEAYIKSLSYTIVNIVQTILIERNESFSSVFGRDLVVWNELPRLETVADIKKWLIYIVENVRRFLDNTENGRYQKIVEDIKSIINEEYSKIENVGQIISSLYISASHANFIFKQQTGQTIFDYLIMKRMEVAKNMLLDPYIKIYEIAEKTGYNTKSYFASVFKEYTGLTPKQFRDKHSV